MFGDDGISYGFLKKMKGWISQELTDRINLSLEIAVFSARIKPLFKGKGCERTPQHPTDQLPYYRPCLKLWRHLWQSSWTGSRRSRG